MISVMRRLALILILVAAPLAANERFFGWCQSAGKFYRGCLVTVYQTGTLTLAPIYSDNVGTAQSNPFQASSVDGYYYFYAANGRYDVQTSGGTAIAGTGGGGGGGTTVSSIPNVTTLPATCTPSGTPNIVFLLTGAIGPYACTSNNIWTPLATSSPPANITITTPSWLTGGSVGPGGTLVIVPTAGQTSHRVIGTCGTGTTFVPCQMATTDLSDGPNIGLLNGTNTWTNRNQFTPGAANAGVNVGTTSADPSGGADGDIYYSSSTLTFRCHKNGVWEDCASDEKIYTGDATTVLNGLVKLVGGVAVAATTSDTGGVIGICRSKCGVPGLQTIRVLGPATCNFDANGVVNGHYVQISNVTNGACRDTSSIYPSGIPPNGYPGQIVGKIINATASGAGAYSILLWPEAQTFISGGSFVGFGVSCALYGVLPSNPDNAAAMAACRDSLETAGQNYHGIVTIPPGAYTGTGGAMTWGAATGGGIFVSPGAVLTGFSLPPCDANRQVIDWSTSNRTFCGSVAMPNTLNIATRTFQPTDSNGQAAAITTDGITGAAEASPQDYLLDPGAKVSGTVTDASGNRLHIMCPAGTGAGNACPISFYQSVPGSTGTSVQTRQFTWGLSGGTAGSYGNFIANLPGLQIGSTLNPPQKICWYGTAFGTTSTCVTSLASINRALNWPDLGGTVAVLPTGDTTTRASTMLAAITADSGAINTVETSIVSATIPANAISAGTTYRVVVWGRCTATAANISNLNIRFGTTGTSADTLLETATPTSATTGTSIPFTYTFLVTFRGATVAQASHNGVNNGTTGLDTAATARLGITNTGSLVTSVQNILQFSYSSAASTTTSTFVQAQIEQLQ